MLDARVTRFNFGRFLAGKPLRCLKLTSRTTRTDPGYKMHRDDSTTNGIYVCMCTESKRGWERVKGAHEMFRNVRRAPVGHRSEDNHCQSIFYCMMKWSREEVLERKVTTQTTRRTKLIMRVGVIEGSPRGGTEGGGSSSFPI